MVGDGVGVFVGEIVGDGVGVVMGVPVGFLVVGHAAGDVVGEVD